LNMLVTDHYPYNLTSRDGAKMWRRPHATGVQYRVACGERFAGLTLG
jgi:hypothetical protein